MEIRDFQLPRCQIYGWGGKSYSSDEGFLGNGQSAADSLRQGKSCEEHCISKTPSSLRPTKNSTKGSRGLQRILWVGDGIMTLLEAAGCAHVNVRCTCVHHALPDMSEVHVSVCAVHACH